MLSLLDKLLVLPHKRQKHILMMVLKIFLKAKHAFFSACRVCNELKKKKKVRMWITWDITSYSRSLRKERRAAKTHKARSEWLGSRANNVCHNCPLSIPSSNERSQRNMGLPWVIYDAETQEPSLWNHLCWLGCSFVVQHLIWFQVG